MTLSARHDVDAAQSWRRARRTFVRAHHPDLGGDPAAFRAGLARFDRVGQDRPTAGPEVTFVGRPRGAARLIAWLGARRRRPRPPRVR